MLYFVGYCFKFNIITNECRQIDFSPDKLAVTIEIQMQTKTHIHNNMQHSHNTNTIDIDDIILDMDRFIARIVIEYLLDVIILIKISVWVYISCGVLCFTIYEASTLGSCKLTAMHICDFVIAMILSCHSRIGCFLSILAFFMMNQECLLIWIKLQSIFASIVILDGFSDIFNR